MTAKAQTVIIQALNKKSIQIRLVGDSPLVTHQWSEKAKREMRDKQQGKARKKKDPKDPNAEFEAARYVMPDGRDAVPTGGIKKCLIAAGSFVDGITKVGIRGALHVNPGQPLIPLENIDGTPISAATQREDVVRIYGGTADLRYRPEYPQWAITIDVVYQANLITPDQIVNLCNQAGFSVGLCESRPQKDGQWGMFHVETSEEADLREANSKKKLKVA